MWRFHVNKAEKLIGYSIETLSYEYVVVNGTRLRLSKNDEDRRSDRGLFRFVTEQGADVFLIGGSYCYIQNQLTEGKFTAVNDGTVLCRVGDRRQAATLFRITKHNDSTLSFRTTKGTYLMCGHNSLIHGSPVSISGYLKLKTRIGFYRVLKQILEWIVRVRVGLRWDEVRLISEIGLKFPLQKKYYAVIERSLRSWKDKGRYRGNHKFIIRVGMR
eukprot:537962-Amorphochlora_amoeboformis.AAC.3